MRRNISGSTDSPLDQPGDMTPTPLRIMQQVPTSDSESGSRDDIDNLVYRLNRAVARLQPASVNYSETTAPPRYENIA